MTAASSQTDGATIHSVDPVDYVYVDTAVGGTRNRNNIRRQDGFRPPVDAADCYATWFRFLEEFAHYAATNTSPTTGRWPSVAGYHGPAWTPVVYWDFDHQKDPGQAQADALALIDRLIANGIPSEAIRVYFSGKKGFGVEVDASWFGGFPPAVDLPNRVKRLALGLAEGLGTVDGKIYERLRLLRLPNTKHGGTGLYKIPVSVSELRALGLEAIRELAKAPRSLESPPQVSIAPVPALIALWEATAPRDEPGPTRTSSKQRRSSAGASGNDASSRDWDDLDPDRVLDGVPEGWRDEVLFRYSCRLRAQGRSRKEAETLVLEAARKCAPPFPADEALRKVERAWGYEVGGGAKGEDFGGLFNGLRERAREAPGTVVREALDSAEILAALGRAVRRARGPFEALLLWFREWGVKAGDVTRLERAVNAAAKRAPGATRPAGGPDMRPTVAASLPGAPVAADAVVPPGWRLSAEGVAAERVDAAGETQAVPVAPAPIVITGRLADVAAGTESVRLAWYRDGAWRQTTVDRATVANARELVALAGLGLPVTSRSAGELVAYLAAYEAANIGRLPRARVAHQMGWQGEGGRQGFLWGRTLIRAEGTLEAVDLEAVDPRHWRQDWVAFRGQDAGDEQLASGYVAAGSFEEWRRVVALVERYPRVALALWGSLAAPLLEILRAPNFVVDWSYPTSTGKTTTLRVGASCWGDPDERSPAAAIATWDATRVWVERAATARSHLPLILDDTKRARKPADVGQVLYDVASGRGRGRGSPEGTRRSGTWRTVLLSSGEAPATSFTGDGGTRARTLTVWGMPFGAADASTGPLVQRLNLGLRQHFGHAGPRLVRHLLAHRAGWDDWRDAYRALQGAYLDRAGDDPVAGRLAEYLAVLALTARLAREALELPWVGDDPVAALWHALVAESGEADRAARALAHALGWAAGNQHAFFGRRAVGVPGLTDDGDGVSLASPPPQGWAGRWERGEDWATVAFLPHRLREILERGDFDPDATVRTWRDRGWLETGEDRGRTTKKVRIDGEATWAVVVRRGALEEAEGG